MTNLLPPPRLWQVISPGIAEFETPQAATAALQTWLETPAPAARIEAARLLIAMQSSGWSASASPSGGAEKRLSVRAGARTWLVHLSPHLSQPVRRVERVTGSQEGASGP